jgi:hypothetical protein
VTFHRHMSYLLGTSALIVLAVMTTACGGSSPSSSSTTKPSATTGGSAVAQITANWKTFFNGKSSVSQRVALLQDGSQFQSTISAQAGGGLYSGLSAKVLKVTVTSPTQATVKYNLYLGGGSPLFSNRSGTAVLENGTWKVGVTSFCGLLILSNSGKTTGLPAACQAG